MRVICPSCEQSSDLDTGPLSSKPARSSCPRCGVRFEVVLLVEYAAWSNLPARRGASHPAGAHAPVLCADADDVLALPGEESRDDVAEPEPSPVLDLDDELIIPPAPTPMRNATPDRYGLAVRLMNVSPLWLLASGLAFVSFMLVCNWLLSGSTTARANSADLASMRNEATNRSAPRAARDEESREPNAAPQSAHAPAVGYSAALLPPDAQPVAQSFAPQAEANAAPQDQGGNQSDMKATGATGNEQPAPKFTIQTGAYRFAEEAEKRADGLRAAGFEARVVEERPAKRAWYCVQTGLFESRAELEAHLARLREKGLASGYVTREIR